jgi:hypothetical protein
VTSVFLLPENKLKNIIRNKSKRYKTILSWNKYIIPLFTLEEYLKSDKD